MNAYQYAVARAFAQAMECRSSGTIPDTGPPVLRELLLTVLRYEREEARAAPAEKAAGAP